MTMRQREQAARDATYAGEMVLSRGKVRAVYVYRGRRGVIVSGEWYSLADAPG